MLEFPQVDRSAHFLRCQMSRMTWVLFLLGGCVSSGTLGTDDTGALDTSETDSDTEIDTGKEGDTDSDTDSDTDTDTDSDTDAGSDTDTDTDSDTDTLPVGAPDLWIFEVVDPGPDSNLIGRVYVYDDDLEGGHLDVRVDGDLYYTPLGGVNPIDLSKWSTSGTFWYWTKANVSPPDRSTDPDMDCDDPSAYEATAQVFDVQGNASIVRSLTLPRYTVTGGGEKEIRTNTQYGGINLSGYGTVCSWSCDRAWVTGTLNLPDLPVYDDDWGSTAAFVFDSPTSHDVATCTMLTSTGTLTWTFYVLN